MKNKTNMGYVVTIAGSLIALLIGSGFATGQELMQYFSSYGYFGLLGIIVVILLLIFISLFLLNMGREYKYENDNDIYRHMFGHTLGTFMDYYVIFFILYSDDCRSAGDRHSTL